jgi:hypothetical protein
MKIGAGFFNSTGAAGLGALKFKKGGVGQCEIVVDCHSHSKAIVLNC